jgi:hypothetical protein
MAEAWITILTLGAVVTTSPKSEAADRRGNGKSQTVEVLQGTINPRNADNLAGLACRNYGQIVHLKLRIEWPATAETVENTGYKRLVVWNGTDESLFFNGSYKFADGAWAIDGYFIPVAGGTHQGVTSHAFDQSDDPHRLNAAIREIEAKGSKC